MTIIINRKCVNSVVTSCSLPYSTHLPVRGRVSENYVLMVQRRRGRSFSVLSGLRWDFCIPQNVKAGSGVHPHSCPVGMGVPFHDLNRAVVETHSSPPSITKVKGAWSDTPTPTSVLMASCLIKNHNFALSLSGCSQSPNIQHLWYQSLSLD
jgi:hypothetical protein